MKIKKILIVPSWRITSSSGIIRSAISYVKSKIQQKPLMFEGELQFYGDIPVVLGKDNTFVLGRYRSHLLSKKMPKDCAYPSCFGTPAAHYVFPNDIRDVIKLVDAVLISIRADQDIFMIIREARSNNIPVAMLDYLDHESNYGADDFFKELYRGYIPGRDFDVYFKKDLPLGCVDNFVRPIGPVPVRPEMYSFPHVTQDKSVFYSGRSRHDLCQRDRAQTIALLKENFPDAMIIDHDVRDTFISTQEYWENVARSYLALSPSGRTWDSFRHCEVALAPNTALIAPKPYVETAGPGLVDGVNSILYDTEFRHDGKYHLVNGSVLVEKIRYYLNNLEQLKKIAQQWQSDVLNGHTILARSQYIINCIENIQR